jgi:hypothetical protein
MSKKKQSKNIDFIQDLRDLAIYLNDYEDLFDANGDFKEEEKENINSSGLMDVAHLTALNLKPIVSDLDEIGIYSIDLLLKGLKIMKKLGASTIKLAIDNKEEENSILSMQYNYEKKDFYFSIAPRVEEEHIDE